MSIQATSPSPPPLRVLDAEAFRRKLAGLEDPLSRDTGASEKAEIRDCISRLCSILASLYNVPGDRKALWEHIAKAFETSLAKVSDDDLDRFVSLCLESVQAEPALAAACEPLGQTLQLFAVRPPEWRFGFLQHIASHSYAVIVHGRARWERVKSQEIEL